MYREQRTGDERHEPIVIHCPKARLLFLSIGYLHLSITQNSGRRRLAMFLNVCFRHEHAPANSIDGVYAYRLCSVPSDTRPMLVTEGERERQPK